MIYADEIFIENVLVDYILFVVTAVIAGTEVKRLRVLIAALLGGVYAVAAALSGSFLLPALKIGVAAVMSLIVFGGKEHFLRLTLVFFAVSAAFAGAVMGALLLTGGASPEGLLFGDVTFKMLVVTFAMCCAVFYGVFRCFLKHPTEGNIAKITVRLGDKSADITALVDTGNSLIDPVTGKNVTVCALGSVAPLLDRETVRIIKNCKDPATAFSMLGGAESGMAFSLVPYRAVGTKNGLLLAFSPDRVEIDGREKERELIAIAPDSVSEGKGYSALTHAG